MACLASSDEGQGTKVGPRPRLTLVEYPQRRENNPISLLEKKRHPIAANQGHPVPALGHGHVSLLRQDVLKIRLASAHAVIIVIIYAPRAGGGSGGYV